MNCDIFAGFSVACVIGGRDIGEDRKAISKCKAIVGTPGRLLHLIRNNLICLKHIQILVLDEADKLFTDNFRKDIDTLTNALKKDRQTIASSATYADGLDKLIVSYMQNAIAVSATREIPILIGVRQFAFCIESKSTENSASAPAIQRMMKKVEAIESILSHLAFKQCVLFSNSQMRAESFSNYLTSREWTVDLIIGSQDQCIRTSTLDKFRQYKSRILITSDLMARGVDIENINLVINIDVPRESSTYLHRIGRCGRFGTKGIAITLISDEEDLMAFRKLLGRIGGNDLKIAKLPSAEYFSESDPWNFASQDDALKSFEYISGLDDTISNQSNHLDEDNDSFTKLLTNLKSSFGKEDDVERKAKPEQDVANLDDPFSSFEGLECNGSLQPAGIKACSSSLTDQENVANPSVNTKPDELDNDPFSSYEEFKCNGSMNTTKEAAGIEVCSSSSTNQENLTDMLVNTKPDNLGDDPFSSNAEFKCNGSLNVTKENEQFELSAMSSIEKTNRFMFEVAKLLVDLKDSNPIDLDSDPFQQFASHTGGHNVDETQCEKVMIEDEIILSDYTSSESSLDDTTSSDGGDDEASNKEESAQIVINENESQKDCSNLAKTQKNIKPSEDPVPKEANKQDTKKPNGTFDKSPSIGRPTINSFQSSQNLQEQWVKLYRQQVHQIFEYVSNANHQWY